MILNNNIKLIRELSGKTQKEFAQLIKSNLSNVKTYETSDTRPKAKVMAAISDFAGISIKELEERELSHKDLHFEVDKVNGNGATEVLTGAHVTLQDYIDEIKRQRDMFYALLSSNLGTLQEGQRTMIAYQKAWVDHAAELEAKGDQNKKADLKYKFGKLVDDILSGEPLSGIQSDTGKHRRG